MSLLAALAAAGPPVDPPPMWALGTSADDVWVPAGSLDGWLAARDASATTHVDVIMLGDSTTWGAQSAGTGKSPTAYLLREQARADGYLDGGDGVTGIDLDAGGVHPMDAPNEGAQPTYDAVSSVVGTLVTSPVQAPFEAITMTAAGGYTITGWGTQIKVLHYPLGGWLGSFSWSVDGGAETEVTQVGTGAYQTITVATGLTAGLHTVRITNKGGRPTTRQIDSIAKISGGTLAAGTYHYRTSLYHATHGESPVSNPVAVTITAGQRPRVWLDTNLAATMRVYRSTGDSSGPYGLVAEGTPTASAGKVYLDVDDTVTPGAAPTTPTWFYGGDAQTMVAADFLDPAKGIAWHRQGGRGTSTPAWSTALPPRLAITPNPKLVVAAYGINDAQVSADGVQANTEAMIDAVRAAGAEVVVAVPPLRSRPYEDGVRAALRAAATAKGAALVEYAGALGPKDGWTAAGYFAGSDVHPTILGYKVMAAWLWDNLLKLGPE